MKLKKAILETIVWTTIGLSALIPSGCSREYENKAGQELAKGIIANEYIEKPAFPEADSVYTIILEETEEYGTVMTPYHFSGTSEELKKLDEKYQMGDKIVIDITPTEIAPGIYRRILTAVDIKKININ